MKGDTCILHWIIVRQCLVDFTDGGFFLSLFYAVGRPKMKYKILGRQNKLYGFGHLPHSFCNPFAKNTHRLLYPCDF